MTIFENIKIMAKKRGLSLNDVNNLAGLGKNTIYSWKTKTPSIDNISKVANVLNVDVDDLKDNHVKRINTAINSVHQAKFKMDQIRGNNAQVMHHYPIGGSPLEPLDDAKIEKIKKLEPHNYQVRVPILGKIACGEPIFAEQNIIGYKDLTFDHAPDGTLFLLKCQGKSMEPLIPDGSLVTIRRQLMVENGELAAILVGDEATIKRVKFSNGEIILLPENNSFDPIILNEKNPGSIIGKVIHVDYDIQ